MKKIFSIILVVIFMFTLSGCGNKEVEPEKNTNSPEVNDGVVESETKNEDTKEEVEKKDEKTQDSETLKPEHTHNFSAATCTSAPKCSCGETSGSALGHKWKAATCKSPKRCSVCNATDGSKGNHKYVSGVCTYCGDKQVINPKDGLKVNADYYYVSDIGDGDFLLNIYRFSNNTLSPRMAYSTKIELKDGDETINYNGKIWYQIGFGATLPEYILTDTEIIVKYPAAEYRFRVNYAYDLVVTYSSDGKIFKQGTILDLVA